jgi:cytochrome c553
MQLLAFRDGIRKNDMMEGTVADLNEQDMADLAVYFEAQKMNTTAPVPKVLNLQQRADIEVGQSLYETLCARCHGLTGRGQGILPPLAGQYPDYMLLQIEAFQSGDRSSHSVMRDIVKDVSEADLKLIADYLSGLKP